MPSDRTTPLDNLAELEARISSALEKLDVSAREHDQAEAERRARWRRSMKDLTSDSVTSTDEVYTSPHPDESAPKEPSARRPKPL